jgi:hypothetical protein
MHGSFTFQPWNKEQTDFINCKVVSSVLTSHFPFEIISEGKCRYMYLFITDRTLVYISGGNDVFEAA